MKITRIYTGSDQQSHFEEIQLSLTATPYGEMSEAIATTEVLFGDINEPREVPWHNPPMSQYIIMLKGAMEIEIGDGSKRLFQEGDVVLAEDTTGQGHVTRAASEGQRSYLVIRPKNN